MNMLHNKGFDIFPTSLNMGGSSDFLLLFFFCLIVLTSWAKLQSPIEQNFVLILFSFLSLRNTSFDNGDRSDRKPRKLAVFYPLHFLGETPSTDFMASQETMFKLIELP